MSKIKSSLYRYKCLAGMGYVVYRHVFDETKCALEDGIRDHKKAVFVEEDEALDYCRYRNRLVDKHGSDELPA